MKKNYLLGLFFLLIFQTGFAQQNPWSKFNQKNIQNAKERTAIPTDYELLKLNLSELKTELMNAPSRDQNINGQGVNVKFPNTEGTFDVYSIMESSTMHPELQAKYPDIKSYTGFNVNNPSEKISFTVSPYFGFNAVMRNSHGVFYIDSYSNDNTVCMMYDKNKAAHNHTFECLFDEHNEEWAGNETGITSGKTVIDGQMRKYRLALATTIEYTAYIAQQAGVQNGTNAEKKAAVMDALNVAVNRLNEVYENEVSLQMELVPNNDELIFITTDNYNPMDAGVMLGQNQTTVDNIIGSANYDIGHVFFRATAGNDNGVAYRPSVCNNTYKAGGVTGAGNPVGDPFVIDYVAHEMGHQYGANHTMNNPWQRNDATAIEPGSGSTIMSYAGIDPPNMQNNADAYFHSISIKEIYNYITASGNCGANTATGNNEPTVNAGEDKTIPKETPFVLTGIASDPDGDLITYSWEQIDPQPAPQPPRPTNTGGPLFRSMWATESPERYFPRLSTIIEGYDPNILAPTNYRAWEKLPAVARLMNFSLLVRDNNPVGGQTGRDDIKLTVTTDAGPFIVTSQNTEGEVWNLGESKTITWDVANTNTAPVNTQNVTILVSTDGGLTFPYVLAESTPNNGSYTFTVPGGLGVTEEARIMIKAIDNVFLNVNSEEFIINSNLSVEEINQSELAIYPNPSNGMINIELNTKASQVKYSVFNMEGKLISSNIVNPTGGKINQKLNLSHLPNGTYILQVINGSEKISKKIIIKK